MTFQEALDQIAKGRVVARRAWPTFAENRGIAMYTMYDKQLRSTAGKKWHKVPYWQPSQDDIFATNWEVVEANPPKVM